MPVSTDNQDYKNPENQESQKPQSQDNRGDNKHATSTEDAGKLTSDNLKGKKIDADVENEDEKPADV